MRIRHVAIVALAAFLITAGTLSAHGLFRRCLTCTPSNGGRAPGNQEAQPPGAASAPKPAPPLVLNISKSGLETEILKRLDDWKAKGVTPTGTTQGVTKSFTLDFDGQKIEITVTKGTDGKLTVAVAGGAAPAELVKKLQSAFDAEKSSDKAAHKDKLADFYRSLAKKIRGSDELKIGKDAVETKDQLRRFIRTEAANNSRLNKTPDAVDEHLRQLLPLNDTSPADAGVRTGVADQLERVVAALAAVK
jgi:hypothetical protein